MRAFSRALWAAGVVAVLFAGAALFARARYLEAGPNAAETTIVVPRGRPEAVGAALLKAGVIADVRAFRIADLATRGEGRLRAGEFAFPAAASLRDVLAILRTARPVQHRLTIPEGLTAAQIARLIEAAETLDGDPPVPTEGAVLPETYAYERGEPRATLLRRAEQAMDRVLAEIWAARLPDLPIATPQELVVLASMVERETARPEERARVAAVFVNRLRAGMRLQSDPTVAYAVSGGLGGPDRQLTRADLAWQHPANTYAVSGLPAEPICAPGRAALRAAAQPMADDALYFVADGAGGHVFARTLEEHTRNVARWREAQRRAVAEP